MARENRSLQYLNLGGNGLQEVAASRPEVAALSNRFIEIVAAYAAQS